ncbi:MAG TPA: hypothetical protein VGD94_14085 [Vicinamibacterales bacterium]
MTEVIVKFRRIEDSGNGERRIAQIVGADAVDARPLFPGDTLPDLATLYQVRLPDTASVDRVLAALRREPDVEYAHVPAGRTPA